MTKTTLIRQLILLIYSKEKKQQKEKKKQIHFQSQLQNYLVKQSIKLRYYLILICFLSLKKDTIP